MKNRISSLICILVLTLFASTGHASSGGSILVITTDTAKDSSEQTLLRSNATVALRKLDVTASSFEVAELNGFNLIESLECIAAEDDCADLLGKSPSKWVLVLSIRDKPAPSDSRVVVGKLYSSKTGKLLQVEQRECEHCTSERLAQSANELVTAIAQSAITQSATATFVNVSSHPSKAVLSIDGSIVGPTGQPYRVSPGTHDIEVRAAGYRVLQQTVVVTANEHKAMSVSLADDSAVGSADGGAGRLLKWGALGLGAAAVGGGILWLAADGTPVGEEQHGEVKDTKVLGISSLVVGTVLIGTGITVFFLESDSDATQLSVRPQGDGFSLGLSGRF